MIQGNYTVADKCKFIIFQKTNNLSSSLFDFLYSYAQIFHGYVMHFLLNYLQKLPHGMRMRTVALRICMLTVALSQKVDKYHVILPFRNQSGGGFFSP